jgi:hypothetical protein
MCLINHDLAFNPKTNSKPETMSHTLAGNGVGDTLLSDCLLHVDESSIGLKHELSARTISVTD